MVKIPSFDDLKKAGANLVDSAKSGKLVDNIKSHIENVGERLTKDGAEMPQGQFPVKEQFQALQTTLRELYQLRSAETELLKKFETQLGVLAKLVNTDVPAQPVVIKTEDKKEP